MSACWVTLSHPSAPLAGEESRLDLGLVAKKLKGFLEDFTNITGDLYVFVTLRARDLCEVCLGNC
jgi:hypothetical protein